MTSARRPDGAIPRPTLPGPTPRVRRGRALGARTRATPATTPARRAAPLGFAPPSRGRQVNCAACGTSNEVGRKFCMECGAPLARACPACGSTQPAAGKFCGECGDRARAPAAADAASTARRPDSAAPTTERRLVSVLFLDLVVVHDALGAPRRRGHARPARRLLRDRADRDRAARRRGREVHRRRRDGGLGHAGHARGRRGARGARRRSSWSTRSPRSARRTGRRCRLAAGVLTGEAATSPGVGNQGMVTGDMVNTASRLQSAAEPG